MLNSSSSGFFLPIVSSSTAMIVSRFKSFVFCDDGAQHHHIDAAYRSHFHGDFGDGQKDLREAFGLPGFSTSEALVNNMPPGATPWRHCS